MEVLKNTFFHVDFPLYFFYNYYKYVVLCIHTVTTWLTDNTQKTAIYKTLQVLLSYITSYLIHIK